VTKAIAYCRVSTAEQSSEGHSLDAQREAIAAECKRRGWQLVSVETDVASGKSTEKRPGLGRVLAALRSGEADVLIAVRLDRISRSLAFLAGLLEECSRGRTRAVGTGRTRRKLPPWQLVVLDANGIDMTSAQGELLANVLGAVARMERRLISDRTRDGLAHARIHGTKTGRAIGRPAVLGADVRGLVVRLRRAGKSWPQIAATLTDRGYKTAHDGARWYASTVRKVYLGATQKPKGGKQKRS
jgi:DNA invertase Pin-like site-specific DNA recombinase